MPEIDFLGAYQNATKRDYRQRVLEHDKAECAAVAKRWGKDYWDGDRKYGYGGMRYDGRWRPIAEAMAKHYGLKAGDRILDVGCGKGYLLYEFTQVVPGVQIAGLDISSYAIEHAHEPVRPFLKHGSCAQLPWPDKSFDLAISINVFHNLQNFDLDKAVREMTRVCAGSKWICVESYRSEQEKANLLYWQLTCETFFSPEGWKWFLNQAGYNGDWGFITFR